MLIPQYNTALLPPTHSLGEPLDGLDVHVGVCVCQDGLVLGTLHAQPPHLLGPGLPRPQTTFHLLTLLLRGCQVLPVEEQGEA